MLGPLTAWDDGVVELPTAPKTRQLLALLLINANSPVPLETCLDELWPSGAPRSAVQSVHTRVFHIRQALAAAPSIGSLEAAKDTLSTRPLGYRLRVARGALDVALLEESLEEARLAHAAGDDRRLSGVLRSVLGLWRGPTLVDVRPGPQLQAAVAGLEERRLTALEQCVETELRLGLHHELLFELGSLVAQYPTHENLHAHYMIALYRSGRVGQALEIYHLLREALRDDLGIEPSPRLRRLQSGILTASPALDVAVRPGPELSLNLRGG
ncbi:AfsR/SARP family transcriptional regulator [Streptomyces olivoreticuli]